SFPIFVLPELILQCGEVPLVPYGTPGTPELGTRLEPYLDGHEVWLLANHGAVTVGSTLDAAWIRVESLAHGARIMWYARGHGGAQGEGGTRAAGERGEATSPRRAPEERDPGRGEADRSGASPLGGGVRRRAVDASARGHSRGARLGAGGLAVGRGGSTEARGARRAGAEQAHPAASHEGPGHGSPGSSGPPQSATAAPTAVGGDSARGRAGLPQVGDRGRQNRSVAAAGER